MNTKKPSNQKKIDRLEQKIADNSVDLNAVISDLKKEITEHKATTNKLTSSQERMKRLSRQILDVLEADRQTISKELHDSIGASLAAIKFSLEDKEMTRFQNNGRLDESLDQEIAYLMETIKETKRISANLRPTTLDDLGLLATIEWYIRQFKRLYGDIRIDYTNETAERDIPEALKIIIYRIIQEGLTNAEKHSEASAIRLSLKSSENKKAISLSIEDNGRGFEVDKVLSKKDPLSGYGLTAMLERCEIVGGSFHVHSTPNHGTKITVRLPL